MTGSGKKEGVPADRRHPKSQSAQHPLGTGMNRSWESALIVEGRVGGFSGLDETI